MGAEASRVTPDMTHGQLVGESGEYFLKKLLPPSLMSSAAQGTIIALEKKTFGESIQLADWLGGLPITEKFLSSTVTSLLMLSGAFLGEFLVKAKRKVGLEPEKWLPKVIWHGSIATQFASVGASLGKVAFQAEETWTNMVVNAQFFLGDLACIVGGAISVADNFRPRSETGNNLREMIWPTVGMVLGIGGFILAPIEDKPKLAGFCVASIANFVENTCEINWRAEIPATIANIKNK
ncbi:hypothetical protein KKE48_02950 [Patescibacteria group bacterium]|nr:hypothetical protein [Planctomycetota bacterium]MBU1499801.1 hypothetical protein [Patescibacteria group bacterium]